MPVMRRLPAVLLLAASGCAQLFGIDDTSGAKIKLLRTAVSYVGGPDDSDAEGKTGE